MNTPKNECDITGLDNFSNLCKDLLNRKDSIAKSQANDSIAIKDFISDEDIANELDAFSKQCRSVLSKKKEAVSTNLY